MQATVLFLIFVLGSTSASAEMWKKSSKVGHPNYFSSHIFWMNNLEGMRRVRRVPHWRRWQISYSDISEEETIWKS